jgi:hypothetical protein
MYELAEIARLRADVAAAPTDRALARLEEGMTAAAPTAIRADAWIRGRTVHFLAVAATTLAVAAAAAIVLPRIATGDSGSSRNGTGSLAHASDGLDAPSVGVAGSAAQLVAFATSAGAKAPPFNPSPHDWMYLDVLEKGLYMPAKGVAQPTWTQVGTGRVARRSGGRLKYTGAVGPGAQLEGWPGSTTRIYHYLAALPASAPALRSIILANNSSTPASQGGPVAGAFNAIEYLMDDYPLPPRLLAELYAVVVSLPGVRFDASATDAAGRHGVGLYLIESGFLEQEIIINPRTYAYLGLLWVAVRASTQYGTSPRVVRYHQGAVDSWTAVLGSAVVPKAGQLARRPPAGS